ncbi:imidazole glycerol phosphate synthase subunit HisH [Campylobacter sp.]|uniref:imidazole glycerol phosphate synthase subunit HisH n=1 Tax=Campylobacter sp. TaxID=205 RepID=UPI0026DBB1E2|nr:imidazole glycerol phosphate synthase subunit HisH [Campylobacter sp.]MDO4674858.1 imidazole glycerol phosphate synthase subunit HisH [Campylobacter sp.]
MRLAIIDSSCANLASLAFCLERLGFKASISKDVKDLERADKLFLPGVGTARRAILHLKDSGLIPFIQNTSKPVFGICLGMQLLGEFSEELNQTTLGVLPFQTRKLKAKPGFCLPHMGWNSVESTHDLFAGLNGAYFYFTHSYCIEVNPYTIASCTYTEPFSAAVARGNFYGVQFHPERSGEAGELLLKNFILS